MSDNNYSVFSRRHLIQSASVLLACQPIKAAERISTASVPTPSLSPALLSGVSLTLGQIAARIHQHTSTPRDMQVFGQTLEMLRQHLLETNFNSTLRYAAERYVNGPDRWSEFDVQPVLNQLKQYDSTIGYSDLAKLAVLTQTDFEQGMAEIRSYGLSRLLAHPEPQPRPLDDGDPDGGTFQMCPEINYYLGGFASAAFVLQLFGCTPEPIFMILCPTITVINIVLGTVAVASWVLC